VNLFDAQSIVTDLGLIGILLILFAETGLLIGIAFQEIHFYLLPELQHQVLALLY
jgi:hypothetical protein